MSSVIKNGGSDEFLDKLSFPVSLKQPGPRDGTIQCLIKRDKSNMTYHLYLSLTPGSLVESGNFLLSAKCTRIIPYKEYVISMDTDNISKSSSTYIGKIRSNFLGAKFEICDDTYNMVSPRRWFNYRSKKVSPNVSSGSYNIAEVTYNRNLVGPRGPRRIHCSIPTLPIEEGKGPLVLRNKPARWHKELKCWSLNFKGRVTVASVKNFQLMASAQKPGESDQDEIILQFGKVDKDVFTMDYRYPLSAFQAFAICLTTFDTKLACE